MPGSRTCQPALELPWWRVGDGVIEVRRTSELFFRSFSASLQLSHHNLPKCMSRAFRRLSETSRHLSSAASTIAHSPAMAAEYSTRVIGAPNTFGGWEDTRNGIAQHSDSVVFPQSTAYTSRTRLLETSSRPSTTFRYGPTSRR